MTFATRTLITLAAISLAGAAYAADFSNPQPSGKPLPNAHTQAQQTTDYNKAEPAAGAASDDADKTPANSTGKTHKHHIAHHTAPATTKQDQQQ